MCTTGRPTTGRKFRMSDVVCEARRWIGTPYRHQASVLGAGCDCLGLIRGIWRARHGGEPEAVRPYAPDWSEAEGAERLLEGAARHLVPVVTGNISAGEVLVFRIKRSGVAKHIGVATGADGFIHSYSGKGVVETPLSAVWAARIAGRFRFP